MAFPLELCPFSLRDVITNRQHIDVFSVFMGILNGVSHMHSLGVFHMDLKPENVLIGENNVPKLCDFGFVTN